MNEIPKRDWPRVWLNMRIKSLPERVSREIQLSITETALNVTTVLAALAVFCTAAVTIAMLPFDRPIARYWLIGHSLKYVVIFVAVGYLWRRKRSGTLNPSIFNRVMIPLAIAAGFFWGTFPAAVGAERLEVFYLATCITSIYCLIGFFWTLGQWLPSLALSGTLAISMIATYYYIERPEWKLAMLLAFALIAVLLTLSVLASAALVRARYETVNARERKDMIRLLLQDYERGGHDWIWDTDVDLTLLHVPARMVAAAHGDPRFVTGVRLDALLTDSPEALAAIADGRPFQAHIQTCGPNGRGELRMWGRPDFVGDECMGYRGVGSDVGAARRLADAETISERFDAMVTITGGLTHDFNNLLATVMGSVELAAMSATGEQRPHLDRAVDAILRTRRITSDLAVASGFDVTAQPTPFEVGNAVSEVLFDLRPLYPDVDIRFFTDTERWAMADKSHFMRALRNLAENSCQAIGRQSDRQTGILSIDIDQRQEPGSIPMIVVDLTDDGPGVPWEARNRLFEPFFSTRRFEGGSGLGLAVSNGFARQAGGTLTLETSTVGAHFRLKIPTATTADFRSGGVGTSPLAAAADSAPARLAGRFIVIEDDQQVADNVAQWLESLGATVETAGSVRAAIDRFADNLDDVVCVISDVVLPDGEGFDVIDVFRSRRSDLTAIYMSGFSQTLPASVAVHLRCPLVAKPFSSAELMQALHQAGVSTPIAIDG